MELSKDIISDYNASRSGTDKSLVCHAPFVNLNFEQNGNVRACCYNTSHILGKWPAQTVKQIWQGEKAEELRGYIRGNDLGGGCTECGKMIAVGNHQGVRARYYDEFAPNLPHNVLSRFVNKVLSKPVYPKVMEFELSNECNLECVMCNGSFSSSIRKNREKLPPIISPYNDKFVDELEEFIPHLTDAKFLGGEPFMIEIYLSIWERIKAINPNIRIHITTNGTFLNNRIKDLLEGLRAGIILSIDSVNKPTYQKIRVNGNFEKVMDNLEYFLDYTKRKRTFISIAACPIIDNWRELPELLEFCLAKNIALYFNAVFTPFELSLREQSVELQREILGYLENYKLPPDSAIDSMPRKLSINAYKDFIKQLRGWLQEREGVLKEKEGRLQHIEAAPTDSYPVQDDLPWSVENTMTIITEITSTEGKGQFEKENQLKAALGRMLVASPSGKLFDSMNAYLVFQKQYAPDESVKDEAKQQDTLSRFAELIDKHPKRDQILGHLSTLSPLFFAKWIGENSFEMMQENLLVFFN
jgi:organic radical activating enzyme